MIESDKSCSLKYIFVLIAIFLVSCQSDNLYSGSERIPENSWNRYNKPVFSALLNDTINPCDVLITIRTNPSYNYRNIFLFITTSSPGGQSIKDTVEYKLADERGNWYGKGLGDIHDLSVPFKTNVLFPENGTYTFMIEQGMRDENLEGVLDLGLRVIRK